MKNEAKSKSVTKRENNVLELFGLQKIESKAWENILGVSVDTKPVPDYVTLDTKEKFGAIGIELRYIPKLNFGTLEDIKNLGVEGFLQELERRYVRWKRYESLSKKERENHSVVRGLSELYWSQVKHDNAYFPTLSGCWFAVETIQKPAYGDEYKVSSITELLGFSKRFNHSYNEVVDAIDKKREGLLTQAGLPTGCDVRFLEAVEWNLLANREGWGGTDTSEWTNRRKPHRPYTWTNNRRGKYYISASERFVIGDSTRGGAASISVAHCDDKNEGVGFRVAIALNSVSRAL